MTKKREKKISPNEGDCLYTKNNFVYFTCTDKLFDKKTYGNIVLYFDSYKPPYLYMFTKSNYKRKYEKNYTRYNYVLKNYTNIVSLN